jgi:hypothetical protein
VLGRDGHITEFIATGVSEAERAAMGHIPHGRGILGVLIRDARPTRPLSQPGATGTMPS